MKKWEEEQRKKNHYKKVNTAKATVQSGPKKAGMRVPGTVSTGGIQDGTTILAISNGVPSSVTGSAYSKGPISGKTGQSTKFPRISGATTGNIRVQTNAEDDLTGRMS